MQQISACFQIKQFILSFVFDASVKKSLSATIILSLISKDSYFRFFYGFFSMV